MTKGLLDCAERNGLATIDSFPALAATAQPRQLYGLWHMTEAGPKFFTQPPPSIDQPFG